MTYVIIIWCHLENLVLITDKTPFDLSWQYSSYNMPTNKPKKYVAPLV